MLVGEQIIHGYDIARTVGRRWSISAADALLALPVAMIPLAVNPETAHGHTASYEVRVRGGPRFVVRFRDGVATVEQASDQAVDCHLWADPARQVPSPSRPTKGRQAAPHVRSEQHAELFLFRWYISRITAISVSKLSYSMTRFTRVTRVSSPEMKVSL